MRSPALELVAEAWLPVGGGRASFVLAVLPRRRLRNARRRQGWGGQHHDHGCLCDCESGLERRFHRVCLLNLDLDTTVGRRGAAVVTPPNVANVRQRTQGSRGDAATASYMPHQTEPVAPRTP